MLYIFPVDFSAGGRGVRISRTLPPGNRCPLKREFSQKLAGGIGNIVLSIHKCRVFKTFHI